MKNLKIINNLKGKVYMKKILCLALMSVSVISCASNPTLLSSTKPTSSKTIPVVYIHCVGKYTHNIINYYKKDRTDKQSTLFKDVTESEIVDINGKHWLINSLEWKNYSCQPEKVNK